MLLLTALISLGVLAVAVATYSVIAVRQRRGLLERAISGVDHVPSHQIPLRDAGRGNEAVATKLLERLPVGWLEEKRNADVLVQAGYESAMAPLYYASIRLALLVGLPALALLIAPRNDFTHFFSYVVGFALAGWVIPVGFLQNRLRVRQERVRRSVPDCLDLLVVCVEAGISLDAAILRVAKEMSLAHPDLAHELIVINRKTNAGIAREEALRGLWSRTGVDELRALVSSMIQSEKWGTSIATVLRVNAESLRRKRRQAAEKKAHTAALKMTIPLVTMILPPLFVVVMGPAVIQLIHAFRGMSR
jgi:tight adherence protein C